MYIPQQWERVDTNLIHTYNNENKTHKNDATHHTTRKYTGNQIATQRKATTINGKQNLNYNI